MSPRGRARLFLAITVLLAAVFARLGVWQLSRLHQRRAANRVALARRAQPPTDLDDPVSAARFPVDTPDNRRVSLTGRYDHAAEVVIRGQSEGGVPGVRILTPLRPLRDDTAILVQRGFVPSGDARRVDLAGLHEDGVVRVTGLAFGLPDSGVRGEPLEGTGGITWRRVDLAALRARLPYPLASFLILQTPDSALPKLPRRDSPPTLDDGPHLSYAIQWFAFATTALVVGGIIWWKGEYRVPSTE
jgi:surfeit locus 1 family protein